MVSIRYFLDLLCGICFALLPFALLAQNTVITSSSFIDGGGSKNVMIGPDNTYSATFSGSYNLFTGYQAGQSNTIGAYNVFTGYQAGQSNTTGTENAFTGAYAGRYNTTGSFNVFTGFEAGNYNTTGRFNVFTGYEAGYSNTTGANNVFAGNVAGRFNTIGGNNVFTGTYAGSFNSTGSYNAITGFQAGFSNTTGSYNVIMGFLAGAGNTTGDFNAYLGTYADATGANKTTLQHATALGFNAKVAVNDGLVLGDTTNAKVGIGTAYPNERLTLRGNMNFVAYDNSLRLKNQPFLHFNEYESLALGLGAEIPEDAERTLVLGSSQTEVQLPGVVSNYLANSGQVLTVDERGKVLLTKPRIQIQSTSEWSDKVFEAGYALRPLGEVEDFVKKNKHLPGVLSAEQMVTEGMEATAFNAKLLEKIEELTLYVVALEKRLAEIEKSPNTEQK